MVKHFFFFISQWRHSFPQYSEISQILGELKVNSSFGFRGFIFCEFMLSFRVSRLCIFWCYVCNLHTYRNHKAFLFICTSIWLFHLINNTCMSKSLRFLYYRSVRDTKWKNRWKAKGNVTYTCELSQLLNFFQWSVCK